MGISGSSSPNAASGPVYRRPRSSQMMSTRVNDRADGEQRELGRDRVPVDGRSFPPVGRDDLLAETRRFIVPRRHDLPAQLVEADLACVGVELETVGRLRP